MTEEYPAGYALRIKILDGLIFLLGLSILATPPILKLYPGDIDTSVHTVIGAIICVAAVFRVLVAHGSAWLEFVICFLGVLTFLLPRFMHMMYDHSYSTAHMAAGAALIVLSIISGISTLLYLRTHKPATH